MREKVKLLSTAGTGHFYVATKNKRLHPDKMEVKKYDPVVRKHVAYKESKIELAIPGEDKTKRPRRETGGAFSLVGMDAAAPALSVMARQRPKRRRRFSVSARTSQTHRFSCRRVPPPPTIVRA